MTAQSRPDELIRILRAEFVTKSGGVPGGGATCVTWTCGAIGWRGVAGVVPRTLIHETAFQLSSYGNARGEDAIDLQQLHWAGYLGADVAAGKWSAILGGEENIIEPGCYYSTITGPYNRIYDTSWDCHVIGSFNLILGDSYDAICLGNSHYVNEGNYIYLSGTDHEVNIDSALVCWSLMESNDFLAGGDYSYNSGMYGLFLRMQGQVWMCDLFGEDSKMYNDGIFPNITMYSMAVGYRNYLENVQNNFVFGTGLKSARPGYDGFYDGRILLGTWFNYSPIDFTNWAGGWNQDSWFSQNDMINTWSSAWTTSRFEFPIIYDSTWLVEAYITGAEQNCANVYFWKIEALIKNAGGVTTLAWSVVTNLYRDVVTKEWKVIADNINDRLVFQFRDTAGPDATICNIQLSMTTVEVGGGS